MGNVKFEEARQGYNKEQVERYVTLLQENYKKIEDEYKRIDDEYEKIKAEHNTMGKTMEELHKTNQDVKGRYTDIYKENMELKQQIKNQEELLIEKEKKNRELREEVKKHKETKKEGNQTPDFGEEFNILYKEAQQQIISFKEKRKVDADRIVKEAEIKRDEILRDAANEAGRITEEARQKKADEFEEKLNTLKEDRKRFEEECGFLRQEAQIELDSAKAEAKSIKEQAERGLAFAQEKEAVLLAKVREKIGRIEEEFKIEQTRMHEKLQDSANRLIELYTYLRDIDNGENLDKIMESLKKSTEAGKAPNSDKTEEQYSEEKEE